MDSSWLRGPWGWTYDGSSGYSIGRAEDPQAFKVAGVNSRGHEIGTALCKLIAASPELASALVVAREAINPPDIGGISMREWNQRLKSATSVINAALLKAGR